MRDKYENQPAQNRSSPTDSPSIRRRGRPLKAPTATGPARRQLAEELRRTRLAAGLTEFELALRLGVHHTLVSRVERAEAIPSGLILQAYVELGSQTVISLAHLARVEREEERRTRRSDASSAESKSKSVESLFAGDACLVEILEISPDGAMRPGASFSVYVRIRNVGVVAWRDRRLHRRGAWYGYTPIGSPSSIEIPNTAPGEAIVLSIEMSAPHRRGPAAAEFKMTTTEGAACFPGSLQGELRVQIVVARPS